MLTKTITSVLLLILTLSLRAQWTTSYTPHFRDVDAALVINNRGTIMLIGGNLSNDSIRSVFISTDIGNTWDVPLDIPGKSWLKCVAKVTDFMFLAAGYTGNIMKSVDNGTNWNTIANLPFTNSNVRMYNSIFFVNSTTGYIAGGFPDSLQTILKTTDGGSTWEVQRDTFGYWLNSIFFANDSLGWAVGKKGTLLKTTDGGVSWRREILTGDMGNRDLNAVFFTTTTRGVIVGGIKDSIQTIMRTIDGGSHWYSIIDQRGEMLNAIEFTDTLTGYIAGDNCTVLISSDGGASWGITDIPSSYIEPFDLRAVNFYDRNFGVFAGEKGKYLIYKSGLLDIKESEASLDDSVRIYPVPAQTVLNIEYFSGVEIETKITLTDVQGRVVASLIYLQKQGAIEQQMDVSEMEAGFYVLSICNSLGVVKRKVELTR